MTINELIVNDPKAYNKAGVEFDLRASLEAMENLKAFWGIAAAIGGPTSKGIISKWMPSMM